MLSYALDYGPGGYLPGTPNAAGVPASVPPGNVIAYRVDVTPGLGVSAATLRADGAAEVVAHFATGTAGAHVWSVDGEVQTAAAVLDAPSGLWWSEAAIRATTAHEIAISCNGETTTVEAV